MKQEPIIPIILSGGAGVRLWPLSRAARPKQFLKLIGNHSLIQDTVLRCATEGFDRRPIVVSGESQRFLVAEDLREIAVSADIILEPMRRDSCAAITAGCLMALKRSRSAIVLVLAADHFITEQEKFVRAVLNAREDAETGYLTTFGVKPTSAATGFGYIKPGPLLREGGSHKIDKFVEKPNVERAAQYVRDGFLWNSGNFLFRASRFIEELELHAPAVLHAVEAAMSSARLDEDFLRLHAESFSNSPQISVDYAVMEKTSWAAVYPVDYSWSDIGSWDAVHELLEKDSFGNSIVGPAVVHEGHGNLVYGNGQLTTLVGVDNLVVITTPDAVLVTSRLNSEKLKGLLEKLKLRGLPQME